MRNIFSKKSLKAFGRNKSYSGLVGSEKTPVPEELPFDSNTPPPNAPPPPKSCCWVTLRDWRLVVPLAEGWNGVQSKVVMASFSEQGIPVEKEHAFMFFKLNRNYYGAAPDMICNINCYKIARPLFMAKTLHQSILQANSALLESEGFEELSSGVLSAWTRTKFGKENIPAELKIDDDVWIHSQLLANESQNLLYQITVEGKIEQVENLRRAADVYKDNIMLTNQEDLVSLFPRKK